jgi:hypothetical protein
LHASYDRIFQTPATENLLLASSPELDSVSPVVLRVPVPPAQGNFYEAGVTKSFWGRIRLDANVFRRDFRNFSDGEEVRLELVNWGGFSGFLSYANQSAWAQGPISGGLFIGSQAQGVLTDTTRFAVSQDQRNTLRSRVRFQVTSLLWLALSAEYGSGLPVELEPNPDLSSLVAQFGEAVVSRVNFQRERVEPNFAVDLAAGAELYRKELRSLQCQIQVANVTDRVNVINFASLFSGTAVGAPRMISARLRWTF